MLERSDLCRFIDRGRHDPEAPHVVIPLLGRFKGEVGERCHLLLLANETASGIPVRKCVDRMVTLLKNEGLNNAGPAICDEEGNMLKSSVINQQFWEELRRVQEQEPTLLEGGPEVLDDFNIYRSMRRGSESRATEVGIDSRVIDLINRWRTAEGNRKTFSSMRDYYLDLVLIKERLTKYSASL